MNNEMEMESRIWDYIDGGGNAAERSMVAQLIAEQAEWRAKYSELLDVHGLINLAELEEPSLRFTKNVMEEIAKYNIAPATKNYINHKIIWSIGLFFLTLIGGLLVYGIAQIDWSVAGSSKNTFGFDLTQVDYSPAFSNTFINVFMMLNIMLGLMLLDRFLEKKKSALRNA